MKTLRIGIASMADMKARTMAVARGEVTLGPDEPKLWFTSIESLSRVLSDKNRLLLDLIIERQPNSLAELETLSGRAKSNLSRTLKSMERFGLVELLKGEGGTVKPRVPYVEIKLDLPIGRHHTRRSREAVTGGTRFAAGEFASFSGTSLTGVGIRFAAGEFARVVEQLRELTDRASAEVPAEQELLESVEAISPALAEEIAPLLKLNGVLFVIAALREFGNRPQGDGRPKSDFRKRRGHSPEQL